MVMVLEHNLPSVKPCRAAAVAVRLQLVGELLHVLGAIGLLSRAWWDVNAPSPGLQ